ncbi:MAG TPA: gamma-glutamyl-gamma-aminobutyrate hydrolase family protein, partial [Pseudonocardia sp.]|nr:gamma-glutamyl-gamma-aminobutyrate hydrolase family protein [Pseudonocardia sp.]
MTPLIGITAYGEQAAWGVWEQEAVLLPRTYTDAVIAAGGLPVLLAPRVESAD